MQNRYVGDIGDYVKLAILRALCQGGQRRLGVAWWLFPDEHHKPDGRHREYLKRPDEWKQFDPCLFKALLRIEKEKTRNVRALEDAALLPNAVFADGPIPCGERPFKLRPLKRAEWLERIKTQLKDCDLVFLDPDNGLETPSHARHHAAGPKYALRRRDAWSCPLGSRRPSACNDFACDRFCRATTLSDINSTGSLSSRKP